MATIHYLPASNFANETLLPPRFSDKTRAELHDVYPRIMQKREERRRKRRETREFPLTSIIARNLNDAGLCACGCGGEVLSDQINAIVPDGALFYRIECAWSHV